MKAIVIAAFLAIVVATSFAWDPRSVLACSGGGDSDGVRDSEIILAGRVTGWQRSIEAEPAGGYRTIRTEFHVTEVYKGSSSRFPGYFLDGASLSVNSPEGSPAVWVGAGGACGIFDTQPTGQYLVLGLNWDERGFWRPNRLLVFYRGEPIGPNYEAERARLLGRLGIAAPATGSGSKPSGSGPDPVLALGILLIGFGTITLLVAQRRSIARSG